MEDFIRTPDWFKKTAVEVDSYHIQKTMEKFINEYKTRTVLFGQSREVLPDEFFMVEVWINLKSGCKLINIYRTIESSMEKAKDTYDFSSAR